LIYKSDRTPTEQKNWALRISKNAQHLCDLIGDVLDLSKIEADKIDAQKCMFSLADLTDDVKSVTALTAEEKNIQLDFFNPAPNLDIYSDPIYLRQILINLISNAIKFTPPEGNVEVHLEFKNSNLRILVKDSGVGISTDDQSRIFDPFIQVTGKSKSDSRGTGLGLSISKRLAHALGGDVLLRESSANKGSVFEVNIPCESFAFNENEDTSSTQKSPQKLKGINALVVDDSADNQFLIKHILTEEGAQVDTANNGLEGVDKALKTQYHIIVMDIQMPVLDGNSAISKLRSLGYRKPIVALTAEVLKSQKEESLQRGFDEYLSKPLDCKLLIKTVERLAK
jgi:CheY-like chemotaxis protein/anti-sigma regulatory factor (Ser/Thr protein kinase)